MARPTAGLPLGTLTMGSPLTPADCPRRIWRSSCPGPAAFPDQGLPPTTLPQGGSEVPEDVTSLCRRRKTFTASMSSASGTRRRRVDDQELPTALTCAFGVACRAAPMSARPTQGDRTWPSTRSRRRGPRRTRRSAAAAPPPAPRATANAAGPTFRAAAAGGAILAAPPACARSAPYPDEPRDQRYREGEDRDAPVSLTPEQRTALVTEPHPPQKFKRPLPQPGDNDYVQGQPVNEEEARRVEQEDEERSSAATGGQRRRSAAHGRAQRRAGRRAICRHARQETA